LVHELNALEMSKIPIQEVTSKEDTINHDLIVVGVSSGGVEALQVLVAGLPADLQAAVLVVMHLHPESPMLLADILNRAGSLPCHYAQDGDAICYGNVYLAPPDHHLLVERGRMRLVRGPKENRSRPAIDPLFRSAAAVYGPRTIGVILTGNLNDGSAGLWAVKEAGGLAVVQDPAGILYPSMPRSALQAVEVDHVAPLPEIPALLVRLAAQPASRHKEALPLLIEEEARMTKDAGVEPQHFEPLGAASIFSCPECGGVLHEIEEESVLRFRCRVGHAYTAETLQADLVHPLEQALWVAVRTLEDKITLQRRMAERAVQRGHTLTAKEWQAEIPEMEEQIGVLYQVLSLNKVEVGRVKRDA
jgi:two-component system, chemotaxis family, protein-glutamate methylesterase/glutaminase